MVQLCWVHDKFNYFFFCLWIDCRLEIEEEEPTVSNSDEVDEALNDEDASDACDADVDTLSMIWLMPNAIYFVLRKFCLYDLVDEP